MNIKKYILKTMCASLICTALLSNLLTVNATGVIISESSMDESVGGESGWAVDESSMEEIEVTYKQSSSYFVTIPKTIALDTSKQAVYSIKVTGDIDTNQRVYVAPVDGISDTEKIDFYMKDQTPDSKKADVMATVVQNKFYWNSEEVSNGYEETNNSVSASGLTAGTWKGTFQVVINLESNVSHTHNYVDGVCTECGEKDPNAEHQHNYVDGKCECGAIDPNHTHNYEDGKCTICGEENDPYEVAPADAYNDWNYTLDYPNKTITLNYYINTTSTDTIVYGNYVIDGITYRTKLASNNEPCLNAAKQKYMFYSINNLKTITFSNHIDTSDLTGTTSMFSSCSNLTEINFGNSFNTNKVTDMSFMFFNCPKLAKLDVSSFDTSRVTDMNNMFTYDRVLTNLDLSNFDTSNVTNMSSMFSGCTGITSLDVSNFDTSNVTNMTSMFQQCSALPCLDLTSFNINKVSTLTNMFHSCSKLQVIYVTEEKWVPDPNSNNPFLNAFYGCPASSVTYK